MASRKPLEYPVFQAFDANGAPLSSGTVEFFDAGTTDQRDTYSDPDLTTTNPNPVTLNSRGEPESGGGTAINIYLDNQPYKMVLKDSTGATIKTVDNYIDSSPITVPQDPADASVQTTDDYEGVLSRDPEDNEVFTVDFQSANTTTTPTFENTNGSLGAKTMTTRDGSALWAGAVSGVHDVQYDSGADTYLVLDPIPVIADSTEKTGADDKVVSGTAGTDGNLVQWNADGDAVDGPDVLDEDDMASDDATGVASQQSVKAYVDTQDATFEQQRAQAWVNFDGTGTASIRDHYNVSSITDNGTGEYDVNFSNALADANYAAATQVVDTTTTRPTADWKGATYSHTTAKVSANVKTADNAAAVDASWVQVIVLGGN